MTQELINFTNQVSALENLTLVEAFISKKQREGEPKHIILGMRRILRNERDKRKGV